MSKNFEINSNRKRRGKKLPVDSGDGNSTDNRNSDNGDESSQKHQDKKSKGLNVKEAITSLLLLGEQVKSQPHEDSSKSTQQEQKATNQNKSTPGVLNYEFLQGLSINYIDNLDQNVDVDGLDQDYRGKGKRKGKGQAEEGVGQQHIMRRYWVKRRSQVWWDQFNSPEFPDEEFQKAFKMGRKTFNFICSELSSSVSKENTVLRDAVPVKQRVAVCIWRLATGEPLSLLSKRFGLGVSTCHKLILEVCSAIRTVLMPKYLQWPCGENSINRIKHGFKLVSGIPNVVGSIYTTHIPIIAPKNNVSAYFNKRLTERNHKTSYSVTLQGVVNPNGAFTDVCIGWPGSMPDDQILEKSALYHRADEGLLRGVWIAGGCGYPLMDWVLVPYTGENLNWSQVVFNERIGEVQRIGREAFGRLKGRWACLQKRIDVKLDDLPVVIGACCVLHNICEMRAEPEMTCNLVDDETLPEIALRSVNAEKARDAIAHNLLCHFHAGTSLPP